MNPSKNPSSKLSRREFIRTAIGGAGVVVLALKTMPLAFGDDGLDGPTCELLEDEGVLRVKSGRSRYFPSEKHVHYFDLPLALLEDAPLEGVVIQGSSSPKPWDHSHSLKLSQIHLIDIAMGRRLSFSDRLFDHKYLIELPA